MTSKQNNPTRISWRAWILPAALCALVLVILVLLTASWKERTSEHEAFLPSVLPVEGVVVQPFTHTPVFRVDLTVGDTSIRTGESGVFTFETVILSEGVRMNHPELRRAVSRRIDEATGLTKLEGERLRIAIIFDVGLYNTLIQIADLESRNKLAQIYDLLDDEIRTTVTRENFLSAYDALFGSENITDQVLLVGRVRLHTVWVSPETGLSLQNVVEVPVYNATEHASYFFVQSEDGWQFAY